MAVLMASRRPAPGGLMLRGRDDERAALDRLLDEARAGQSGVLVLRGEAGVGKTALLEHAIESASGLIVVRAVGVESEMELAYAALHQLCAPLLDRVDRIPAPQREALETTFGLREGPVPDRFLVGLATLSLLSEAAQERPLVCVIDDAQWLDQASAQVLAFVARRLRGGVGRGSGRRRVRQPENTVGFRTCVVEGLQDADARALLASAIPGRLDERVADQLRSEARGNPLALLELPRGLSPAQLAGGFGLPGALSLSGKIEESFANRLEALPEDTQQLLLVAAAEPTGDPALLWSAAARLGIADAGAVPGGVCGLDRSRRAGFGFAIRWCARRSTGRRRRISGDGFIVRWPRRPTRGPIPTGVPGIWPRQQPGPDEDVAVELERAAGRAQARGGLAAPPPFSSGPRR